MQILTIVIFLVPAAIVAQLARIVLAIHDLIDVMRNP